MQFFKRKVMYPRKRSVETSSAIDTAFKDYNAHLKRIRGSLPAAARALSDHSFHDATIKEVKHLAKEVQILIESDGYDLESGKELGYGGYTLSFLGVKKAWVPYSVVGDTWLYEEMHLSDLCAFDYRILLVNDEIRIQADDVRMTQSYKWSGGKG